MEEGATDGASEAYEQRLKLRRSLAISRRLSASSEPDGAHRQLAHTLDALLSADAGANVQKNMDNPHDGTTHCLLAQVAALRHLAHDCLPPEELLRAACAPLHTPHAPVANEGPSIAHSSTELRRIRESRSSNAVDAMAQQMEHQARNEGLPTSVRKRAVIDARSAPLRSLQQQVRSDIALHQHSVRECTPNQLLDWAGPRREDAGELQLMHIAAYEKSRSIQRAQMYKKRLSDFQYAQRVAAEIKRHGNHSAAAAAAAAATAAAGAPHGGHHGNQSYAEAHPGTSNKAQSPAATVKQTVVSMRRHFLYEVLQHGHEFRKRSYNTVKLRKTQIDGARAFHTKKQTQLAREQRERLAALRAEDEESYFKLVKDAKDQRVKTVLQKTDNLLQQLGSKIREQKRAAASALQSSVEGVFEENASTAAHSTVDAKIGQKHEDSEQNEEGDEDFRRGRRMFEATVKEVQEEVQQQSKLLRGPDGSNGELRNYQMAGLNWMISLYNNNLNGILADEMGLGKTIQTIALLAHLMEHKGNKGPHLIVAPKAVLPNWQREFNDWVDQSIMEVVTYDGKNEDRKQIRDEKLAPRRFNVCITHYDLVMRDKSQLSKIQWQYLIVDEGHRLKNHKSKLSELLNYQFKSRFRLLLTGTPIQNNLKELWSLLNFLLPKIFNSSESFKEWFNKPFQGASKDDVDLTEEEELLLIGRLHQVIRPFLLRRKKDEVEQELPDKVEVKLKCEMSAWQKAFYRQIVDHASVGLGYGMGKSRGLQNTAVQLRKACNHPYLFIESGDYSPQLPDELVRASGKFELLDRVLPKLKAGGHRVLLFSQMTKCMDVLEDFLVDRGYKYVRLDGNTKTDERSELLNQFNDEESDVFVFLLSTRAGGLGLNLQGADTVIMFESDWNPQMDQQAEDRAHRIGQRKQVQVIVFETVNSIEEKIIEAAKEKRGIDQKVIQAGLFNNQATAQQRTEVLKDVFQQGSAQLEDERTDVPDEEEINRIIARDQDEFELYQRVDAQRYGGMRGGDDDTDGNNEQMEGRSSRLLTDEELPEWVLYSGAETAINGAEDAEDNLANGKGTSNSRQRLKRGMSFTEPDEELRDILGPVPDDVDVEEVQNCEATTVEGARAAEQDGANEKASDSNDDNDYAEDAREELRRQESKRKRRASAEVGSGTGTPSERRAAKRRRTSRA